ncbi:MAG TPA: tRNA (guanosine(37)-N1)-methyltransferase TrmD [Burkholderiales bacterium]|nr:tRNA (guanosine(37)-N1)-methyltransferase TrmD [Burkholderiales bacterium]
MQFDVVTLFPQMFDAVTGLGVTGRARERRCYELVAWNPRDFAGNAYRSVDDRPYGGGPGMVMLAEPLARTLDAARQRQRGCGVDEPLVLHLTPQGELLDHERVLQLSHRPGLVLLCGRYEGIDERLLAHEVDAEISIGDYVLSGGELAAMVLIDCIVRQLPGVLNDAESASQDSFVDGLLDCPHYTRPERFRGDAVPPVLLSGNHAEIGRWRLKQSLGRTWQRRPDLLAKRVLSADEARLLEEFKLEASAAAEPTMR